MRQREIRCVCVVGGGEARGGTERDRVVGNKCAGGGGGGRKRQSGRE